MFTIFKFMVIKFMKWVGTWKIVYDFKKSMFETNRPIGIKTLKG